MALDESQGQQWAIERHRGEVRMLLSRWRQQGRAAVLAYLDDPKLAGRRTQLAQDINEQRRLGNTGAPGTWKEADDEA